MSQYTVLVIYRVEYHTFGYSCTEMRMSCDQNIMVANG